MGAATSARVIPDMKPTPIQPSTTTDSEKGFGDVNTTFVTWSRFSNNLVGLAYCPKSECFYVSDQVNHRIFKVFRDGTVSVFVGGKKGFRNGVGEYARFNRPQRIVVDSYGILYVADSYNHCIRRVTPDGGVSTLTGDGKKGSKNGASEHARFTYPSSVAVTNCNEGKDKGSSKLYVSEKGSIRVIFLKKGLATEVKTITYTGDMADGPLKDAQKPSRSTSRLNLNLAPDIVLSSRGELYFTDEHNHCIRRLNTISGLVETIAGGGYAGFRDGHARRALFNGPQYLAIGPNDDTLYVGDTFNGKIRMITEHGEVTTLSCPHKDNSTWGGGGGWQIREKNPWAWVANMPPMMRSECSSDGDSSQGSSKHGDSFFWPQSMCIDEKGCLNVLDRKGNMIRRIDIKKREAKVAELRALISDMERANTALQNAIDLEREKVALLEEDDAMTPSVVDSSKCLICDHRKRVIMFSTCKHIVFCENCVQKVRKKTGTVNCPLCRINVSNAIEKVRFY